MEMSGATASVLAQLIAVFFLAMILEARGPRSETRPRRARKDFRLLLTAATFTFLVELGLVVVVQVDGVDGAWAIGAWGSAVVYFALTIVFTLSSVASRSD